MSTQINYRSGTAAQNDVYTGAPAEITVDTTNVTLRVHDGTTVGGSMLITANSTATLTNKTLSSPSFTGNITGNLVPSANAVYNLGSPDNQWNEIYAAGATIYLGAVPLSVSGNSLTVGGEPVLSNDSNASVTTSGNVAAGNVAATQGTFTTIAGTLTTAAQPNITSLGTLSSVTVTGNVAAGNLTTTGAVTGNGRALTSLNASNIDTGTLPSARLSGSYSISVTSATTAGTVTTAAQPNITSVGTLTSLTVNGLTTHTGNIDVTGNINVTGNLNYDNVTDLVVGDPLIYLGADNTGNLFDLGFVVSYNDGTYQHGGFARDASDGVWKVFGNVVPEPTTTINFTNAIYQPVLMGALTATTGTFTGNVTTANVSGTVGAFSSVSGTLTTASQTNITGVGTITTGTWQGNSISTTYTAAKVTSVNGSTGAVTGLATTGGTLAQFAATTSSQLAGVISDETGSGSLVFATSPTLVTPVLGAATGTSLALTGGSLTARTAATQDGVIISGRAGGSGTFAVTLTPTTLGASRTLTLPDNSGTVLTTGATVTVPQGGTGQSTLTANNVLLGNGTSAVQVVAPGSNGNVLTSNGTTWVSSAPASSGITTGKSIAMAMIFGF